MRATLSPKQFVLIVFRTVVNRAGPHPLELDKPRADGVSTYEDKVPGSYFAVVVWEDPHHLRAENDRPPGIFKAESWGRPGGPPRHHRSEPRQGFSTYFPEQTLVQTPCSRSHHRLLRKCANKHWPGLMETWILKWTDVTTAPPNDKKRTRSGSVIYSRDKRSVNVIRGRLLND